MGHIARPQPYSFPKGREATELRNYKRAVEVWMGDYKKYVYRAIPAIQVDVTYYKETYFLADQTGIQQVLGNCTLHLSNRAM